MLRLLCRPEQCCCVDPSGIALRRALFWMNLHRDLLAADESALARMRVLVAAPTARRGPQYSYLPDLALLTNEVERVRLRLDHWLGLVDRLRRSSP